MEKYYTIEEERIVIRPLAFLMPIGIAILVLFLLLPIMTILMMVRGHFQEIEGKNFGVYLLMIPLILGCIPFFTYSRRQVIFDRNQRVIYLKTVFGKKTLMTFVEMGEITLKATLGVAYYLKSKADRYGKGYRISPSFSNAKDRSKQEYEQVLLPVIREILITQPAPVTADNNKLLFQAGVLAFYEPHAEGYFLKPKGTLKYLPAFIAFLIFGGIAWYPLISGEGWPEKDQVIPFIPLIPLIITLAMITRRIVFDIAGKRIRLYHFGLPIFTYPVSTFSGFSIVRKTHNGLYSGTDVRMKFTTPGSKTVKELTLGDFGKTNPIEPFLDETEFILAKLR